ncbi:hypothetical protein CFBP5875_01355 [Agrobacterium pusense]|uniref:hypothetical protein n=1 Tax=Agrobacterium pusense TaxID=648995 RepID=UPI0010BE3B55|nr:hypothetical protein [Agrobacterium pusense]QCL83339.1 hypothetical protein CFBP5875_01355 [Agrobacterium pusense]
MTELEIRTLVTTAAEAAAKETIKEVFQLLRVDPTDIDSVTSFGDDLRYLRRQRQAAEKISFKAMLAFFGAAASGAAAILYLGLQDFLGR